PAVCQTAWRGRGFVVTELQEEERQQEAVQAEERLLQDGSTQRCGPERPGTDPPDYCQLCVRETRPGSVNPVHLPGLSDPPSGDPLRSGPDWTGPCGSGPAEPPDPDAAETRRSARTEQEDMPLSAPCRRDAVRERLEATGSGIRELDYLRDRQEELVRTALQQEEEEEEEQEEEAQLLEDNILLLRKQLNCLRRRDAGLISQLQELDRQISDLRLDTEESHDQLETDSRPSSGFYELSDGASCSLSNSSNSVFSECFCSMAETDGRLRSAGTQPIHNQYTTNTLLIHNQYTTNTQPVHNQYTTNTQPVYNQYTTSTQPIHNQYKTNTQPVYNQYTTNTKPIHNQYTTNTQPIHNQYTTSTQPVHNQYTTSIQPIHNQYTTNTQLIHNQ
ncbi:uncharacterized protein LOC141763644, partial [Sebastes fasciatus]|uniref:uncharacterized protein LOC141763644 n=1 Tax=Sebastes fasciatus TaxID=394691 RepID=UPI003D9F70B0